MDNNCDKDRGSEHISCWTHFYISSVGEYSSDKGFVSKKEDTFDPDELTELLGIKPRNAWKYGDHIEVSSNPDRRHLNSGWFSERVYEPPVDRFDHFHAIIQNLIPHEKELVEFKKITTFTMKSKCVYMKDRVLIYCWNPMFLHFAAGQE